MNKWSKKLKEETKDAIKYFGAYTFNDKGPCEIMDCAELAKQFKSIKIEEQIEIAKDLKKEANASLVLSKVLVILSESKQILDEHLRTVIFAGHSHLKKEFNEDFLNNTERYQEWIKKF